MILRMENITQRMKINDKLLKEINDYCKLNNIDDIDSLISKMLKVGFDIEKFGPNMSVIKPKVEVVVETPKIEVKKPRKKTVKEETKVVPNNSVKNNEEEDLYGE